MPTENPMYSEVRAWLVMYSPTLDTNAVLHVTGLVPSYQWVVGDKLRRGTRVHMNSGFEVQSAMDKSASLQTHFRDLLQQILDCSSVLSEEAVKYQAELVFLGDVWSHNGDRPDLHLPKDIIKGIARIGACIDIDLYIV